MHVLWDWNGTLLDDTDACVKTLNIMLTRRGKAAVTKEFFRENFAFPARDFYRLVGMEVPDSEWDALAKEYHDLYGQQEVHLNEHAIAALEMIKAAGIRQSVISALRQDMLDECMRRYGLTQYFDYVFGSDNLDGGSKLSRALELFAILKDPEAVMIGDSLHDKEVADRLGIRTVFCSCGSHAHHRLAGKAPTAVTLIDAVTMARGKL